MKLEKDQRTGKVDGHARLQSAHGSHASRNDQDQRRPAARSSGQDHEEIDHTLLVAIKHGLDFSTQAGRRMANDLASVAAYKAEVRAERIHAGLEVAKEKGVKLGRPKQMGDGKGKRIKVTTEQETIVKRLTSEGQGVSTIARTTGLSRPTIYSIIKGADE